MRSRTWSRTLGPAAAVAVLALAVVTSPAARAADGVSPEVEAKIRQILEVTGTKAMLKPMIEQMLTPMREQIPGASDEYWKRFVASVDPDELMRLYIPIYARYYTADELDQMLAFYNSPIGKKIIAVTPQVMHDSIAAGQEWGMKLGARIQEDLKKEQQAKP